MQQTMRQKIVAGNWKMNGGVAFTRDYFKTFKASLKNISLPENMQILIAPPAGLLSEVAQQAVGSGVDLSAQNVSSYEQGAYTGETSAELLAELNCLWCLVGHSERRALFEEAAGISHYKDRRAQTLRRLQETQRNIERVNDVLTEIEPRLRSLKRQASRAENYETLTNDLSALLKIWYGYQWRVTHEGVLEAREGAQSAEKKWKEARRQLIFLQEQIEEARRRLNHSRGQIQRKETEREGLREQFEHARRHNIYFQKALPDLPKDHPALREFETSNRTICADQLGDTALMRLYEWPPFAAFLAATMEMPELHVMADPLARVNVMSYDAGQALNWHFDRSEFTTTLLLQAPDQGGDFEYRTDLRSNDDPNYEGVAHLLRGEDDKVQSMTLSPGTLNVFRGKNTAHRVTPVDGETSRMIAVFSFFDRPGVTFGKAERIGFYGRAS